ncbi:carbohydrate-binding family 9-like protein [Haloparvum alkalitolerans]|uniref:carbohydrate-binding family 9-like protein n=1 Tax=Haloparvum alkalitolerans TaxID=1042953 RepID=UPI003CE8A9F1
MRTTAVRRVSKSPPLGGDVAGTAWERADPVPIDRFRWTAPERRPSTTARVLYDDETLYLHYEVVDGHSYATATRLNGPVWEDSCVEFFAAPRPASGDAYVNLEVNCVGTFRLGYGAGRTDRALVDPEAAGDVRIRSSIDGPTKDPEPDDEGWWVAAALPFETLGALAGDAVAPVSGDRWRANFYRIRKRPEPLYAAWNPVDAPEPDFHRPAEFGELRFR